MLGLLGPEINLLAGLCVCAKCIIKVVKHVYRKLATFLFSWIIFRVTNGNCTDQFHLYGVYNIEFNFKIGASDLMALVHLMAHSFGFLDQFAHSLYLLRIFNHKIRTPSILICC